jgi:hypothetical protein
MATKRQEWTYTDAPGFFEYPLRYEQGESKTCNRNKALSGIYDVLHPDFKPPHAEYNVFKGANGKTGWAYSQTNLHGDRLGEFRDKEFQKTAMTEEEMKTKAKLDASVERMTALAKQDALDKTSGYIRKQTMENSLDDHSCLRRVKQPWADQRVTTHTYFHTHNPYKPGDFDYDETLVTFIQESERAKDSSLNIIVGDHRKKSYWKCPSSPVVPPNRRQIRAQELLFQNARGATGLKPPSPKNQQKILLKGTGTLCVTHNKDALVMPTYESFSPMDNSAPP